MASGMPTNVATGARYQGGNAFWFSVVQHSESYSSPVWGTYLQWVSVGAQVRKGEKATYGVKFTPITPKSIKEAIANGETVANPDKKIMLVTTFTVFNADQVDGWEAPEVTPLPAHERIAQAEAFFAGIGAKVSEDGDSAYYSPSQDIICIPSLEQFVSPEGYYATLAHEEIHWSGHKSRLDRNLSGCFGSESYAAEELVAEIGSAMVAGILGIESTPRLDHAQYVAGWLKVLRGDPKLLFRAASEAQKATNYLLERSAMAGVLSAATAALGGDVDSQ